MKYLTRFKDYPKGDQWTLGPLVASGCTHRDADGNEWRHLNIKIPPVNPRQLTQPVVIELKDILEFRQGFFNDGAEVLMYVPRPSEQGYTIRLWSRIENAVLPAREGFPKPMVVEG